jgi:hypothetical protein
MALLMAYKPSVHNLCMHHSRKASQPACCCSCSLRIVTGSGPHDCSIAVHTCSSVILHSIAARCCGAALIAQTSMHHQHQHYLRHNAGIGNVLELVLTLHAVLQYSSQPHKLPNASTPYAVQHIARGPTYLPRTVWHELCQQAAPPHSLSATGHDLSRTALLCTQLQHTLVLLASLQLACCTAAVGLPQPARHFTLSLCCMRLSELPHLQLKASCLAASHTHATARSSCRTTLCAGARCTHLFPCSSMVRHTLQQAIRFVGRAVTVTAHTAHSLNAPS